MRKYIDKVCHYINIRMGNRFVSPFDFHYMYEWWERGIPLSVIRESISFSERYSMRKYFFWYLDNYVMQNYRSYLQLMVGSENE